MNPELKISETMALPLNAVTEKLAFLGRTGSGKTYGATKLAEQMHAAGAQIVVIDPVGVWYGLRSAADGKSPGLPIPVFGGLHGDVPLEPTGGGLIADLVVDKHLSCIIDVSQFEHDTDKARFATDFGKRLFFRKKSSPSAMHLFIEEAEEILPQEPEKGEERMIHEFKRIWKLGRNFGIGGSLISQRPQEIVKKALNLTECLFAFQMTGPHERKAIDVWISDKGLDQDIAADLPKLAVGQCHLWSPSWLQVSETVKIAPKWTFNASSTPLVGSEKKKMKLAEIDLAEISSQMKATIENAKANDPAALKLEVRRLKLELEKKASTHNPPPAVAPVIKEVPVFSEEDRRLIESGIKVCSEANRASNEWVDSVCKIIGNLQRIESNGKGLPSVEEVQRIYAQYSKPPTARTGPPVVRRSAEAPLRVEDGTLTGTQRRILDTICMLTVRELVPDRDMVARWLGIHPNGSRYGADLGTLRELGLINGCEPTAAGQEKANPLDTGFDGAHKILDGTQQRIIDLLCNGDEFDRDTLAAALGIHQNGSRYGSDLARLRTMGLIPAKGTIKLTEAAFK